MTLATSQYVPRHDYVMSELHVVQFLLVLFSFSLLKDVINFNGFQFARFSILGIC